MVGIATALRVGRSGDRIQTEANFIASLKAVPGVHPALKTVPSLFPGGEETRECV